VLRTGKTREKPQAQWPSMAESAVMILHGLRAGSPVVTNSGCCPPAARRSHPKTFGTTNPNRPRASSLLHEPEGAQTEEASPPLVELDRLLRRPGLPLTGGIGINVHILDSQLAKPQYRRRSAAKSHQEGVPGPMLVRDLLSQLHLGNSVAEFDDALERYFIETDTFRRLVQGEVDIIAGDKGTGKTALFRILHERYASIDDLANVEVVPAFNLQGNPVFQRLNEDDVMDEDQYITLWKAYIVSLAGNYVLSVYEGAFTDLMERLHVLLQRTGLRSPDDSPSTIFSTVVNLFRRLRNVNAVEAAFTITPEGLPIVAPRVEFGGEEGSQPSYVPHDDALTLLNSVLDEIDVSLWLALDRLDEALPDGPRLRSQPLEHYFEVSSISPRTSA
jgi:hypothetical protein